MAGQELKARRSFARSVALYLRLGGGGDAIPAGFLGFIEFPIGFEHEAVAFSLFCGPGSGNPLAHGQSGGDGRAGVGRIEPLDGHLNLLGDAHGAFRIGLGEDQYKLVSAVASDEVGGAAGDLLQLAGKGDERAVGGPVSEGVVEFLEVIDVDDDDREGIFGADCAVPLQFDLFVEVAATSMEPFEAVSVAPIPT